MIFNTNSLLVCISYNVHLKTDFTRGFAINSEDGFAYMADCIMYYIHPLKVTGLT